MEFAVEEGPPLEGEEGGAMGGIERKERFPTNREYTIGSGRKKMVELPSLPSRSLRRPAAVSGGRRLLEKELTQRGRVEKKGGEGSEGRRCFQPKPRAGAWY